jgi:hypothetical protein
MFWIINCCHLTIQVVGSLTVCVLVQVNCCILVYVLSIVVVQAAVAVEVKPFIISHSTEINQAASRASVVSEA